MLTLADPLLRLQVLVVSELLVKLSWFCEMVPPLVVASSLVWVADQLAELLLSAWASLLVGSLWALAICQVTPWRDRQFW